MKEVLNGKKAWKSHGIKRFLEEVAKNIKGAKDEAKEPWATRLLLLLAAGGPSELGCSPALEKANQLWERQCR